MRSQSILFALAAFAATSQASPLPNDIKAAIVAAGQSFDALSTRQIADLLSIASGAAENHQGGGPDDMTSASAFTGGKTGKRQIADLLSIASGAAANHQGGGPDDMTSASAFTGGPPSDQS
ncbi:hypothetical protein B0J14DRAFT_20845 [Halenospora varia]|nr:hypothetical protein B0J14DRAFT_20845 [Halenospora varia]